jgi:hypothetical protein
MASLIDVQNALAALQKAFSVLQASTPAVSQPVTDVGALPPAPVVATSTDLDTLVESITSLTYQVDPASAPTAAAPPTAVPGAPPAPTPLTADQQAAALALAPLPGN